MKRKLLWLLTPLAVAGASASVVSCAKTYQMKDIDNLSKIKITDVDDNDKATITFSVSMMFNSSDKVNVLDSDNFGAAEFTLDNTLKTSELAVKPVNNNDKELLGKDDSKPVMIKLSVSFKTTTMKAFKKTTFAFGRKDPSDSNKFLTEVQFNIEVPGNGNSD